MKILTCLMQVYIPTLTLYMELLGHVFPRVTYNITHSLVYMFTALTEKCTRPQMNDSW